MEQLNGRNVLACVTPARTTTGSQGSSSGALGVLSVYPLPHQVGSAQLISAQLPAMRLLRCALLVALTMLLSTCATGTLPLSLCHIAHCIGGLCSGQAVVRDLVTDLDLFFQHFRWLSCHLTAVNRHRLSSRPHPLPIPLTVVRLPCAGVRRLLYHSCCVIV